MSIPADLLALALSENPPSSDAQAPSQKWSSAIGIITAISGNILISFALNTQRYAHMRIAREREEREGKLKLQRRRQSTKVPKGYGTQSEIAEVRAKTNALSDPGVEQYTFREPAESEETEPLIPSVDSLERRKTFGDEDGAAKDSDEDDAGEDEGKVKGKSYLKSPIWWAGITMMTLGETGNFLAYGFAPASIVSPLGVVALVSNCLIAPWLLRERFRWRDAIGVIIAVAGCVTVVMSASSSNPKLDPDSIWHLITRWEFETYFGITLILIAALCVASSRFGEKSILIDLGLMGLFGGYTALSTKGVASLLSSSIWRVVTFPITYLLVAILVFTAVMQIKYVNRALQRFDSTQVIPTQFVLFTLSVITGSAILYRDFESMTTEQAVKFVGGCALTFLGVWCITSGRHDESQRDEEAGEDGETINLLDEEGVQPEIREREDDPARRQSLLAGASSSKPASQAGSSRLDLDGTNQLEDAQPDLPPANAAAIHTHSDSTSSANPPASIQNVKDPSSTTKPPMHATTSEPLIPKIDHSTPDVPRTPQTPLKRGYSLIDSPSRGTPAHSSQTPAAAAASTTTPAQNMLDPRDAQKLHRRSVVGLLTGPLSTPLSSSLSAIVADSLRRGVDTTSSTASAAARRRSAARLRSRGAANATPLKRHSIASGEMDFDDDDEDDHRDQHGDRRPLRPRLGSPSASSPGRMRSLSATLGELFGSSPSSSAAAQKRRRMGSRDDLKSGGSSSQRAQQRRREGDGQDEEEDEPL